MAYLPLYPNPQRSSLSSFLMKLKKKINGNSKLVKIESKTEKTRWKKLYYRCFSTFVLPAKFFISIIQEPVVLCWDWSFTIFHLNLKFLACFFFHTMSTSSQFLQEPVIRGWSYNFFSWIKFWSSVSISQMISNSIKLDLSIIIYDNWFYCIGNIKLFKCSSCSNIHSIFFHLISSKFSAIDKYCNDLLLLRRLTWFTNTAQKIKFSIKDFFSKFDQIRIFLQIWSHLLKKSLMENFIFCAVKENMEEN